MVTITFGWDCDGFGPVNSAASTWPSLIIPPRTVLYPATRQPSPDTRGETDTAQNHKLAVNWFKKNRHCIFICKFL